VIDMNTLIRKMFTASVVSAVLSSGAGLVMAETTSDSAYLQHSAEVGHIGWNWWQNSSPSTHASVCADTETKARFAETGPIAWDWWRSSHTHQQMEESHVPFQTTIASNSELGHVHWNWWRNQSSAEQNGAQQC
jgi:hypothetical protein